MSGTNVLKEFLVKIGFSIDDQQFRNFQDVMRKTATSAVDLAKATAGASAVLATSLRAIAAHQEAMYYASERTGSSVRELQDFSFAASQVGVDAAKAQSAVEGLAAARRMNPGLNGMLGSLGIDPRQLDNTRVMVQLLTRLRSMPYYQGAQIAGMFGIDEQTFNMLERGLPQMAKFLAIRDKMFAAAGIDPAQMTARSHQFMQDLRTLEAGIANLTDIVAYRLEPAGEKAIHWLEEMVGWLTRADKATGGWSSKLVGVVSALGGWKAISGIAGMLGRGGGVAAGEAAGAEAAGGLLGLPAIVAAACGAAIVWMSTHPELARKAVAAALKEGEKGAVAIGHAAAREARALPGQIHEFGIGNFVSLLGTMLSPDIASGMTALADRAKQFIAANEGMFRNSTWDYKGYSIGYGHQIQPGEQFNGPISDAQASALLSSDLQKAMQQVVSMVSVKLTDNQKMALADFVYNLGPGALKGSALLRDLNAGDYAGAADQFKYWDKVLKNGHYLVDQGLLARREREAALFRTPDKPSVTISQKTDIHVTGGDAESTGRAVAGQQDRVNGDLVRNFTGAVQ